MRRSSPKAFALILSALLLAAPVAAQEQMGDPSFRPTVARPAYAGEGPLIQLDAAHDSVQTLDGRYAGFAALVRADGYRIRAGERKLDAPGALDGVDVLVISNASAPPTAAARTPSRRARSPRWTPGCGRGDRFCWRPTTRPTAAPMRRWGGRWASRWARATPSS